MELKNLSKCNENLTSKKSRLLSFLNRHHKHSSSNSHRQSPSLCSDRSITNVKNIATKSTPTIKYKLDILRQSSTRNIEQSKFSRIFSERDFNKIQETENSCLDTRLHKGNTDNREIVLRKREKNVSILEEQLQERAYELNLKADLLDQKNSEFIKKEHEFQLSKERFFREMSEKFEKASSDIKAKEKALQKISQALVLEKSSLYTAKDEIYKLECSLFLNELISCIVLQENETKFDEHYYKSDAATESVGFTSITDSNRIDEVSDESDSSLEYDEGNHEAMLHLIEVTKENPHLSKELEEILASLTAL